MGASARIDELRKRYDENPRRFFAPLANEYRKGGDLEQAIDLCRSHLAEAPSNLSGQIVYGQALFESGAIDDARTAFALAVDLDPENLIALRHLGDIARLVGDSETAISWYKRVLDADPRNDEIAELIQAAQATLIQVPEAPAAPEPLEFEPTSLAVEAPAAAEAPGPVTLLEPEPMPEVATLAFDEPEVETLSFDEPVVETLSFDEPAADEELPDVSTLSFDETEEFAPLAHEAVDDDEPHAPLVPVSFGDTAEVPVHIIDIDAAFNDEPLLDASFDDLGFDTPPALELPTEEPLPPLAVSDVDFGVVDLPAADETVAAEPVEWTAWGETAAEPEPVVEESIQEAATLVFAAPVLETEPPADVAPFATETMAQLYLRQGLRTEAIAVYRQLIDARPDDASLRAALAAIETPAPVDAAPVEQGPTARSFFGALSARRAVPTRTLADTSAATVIIPAVSAAPITAATPAPAAHVPGGALDALFGNSAISGADEQAANALAAAFGAAESAPAGRPSHPAAADLSLDQVFRQSAPTPPRPSLAVPRQSASIRFDQFFASPEAAAPETSASPAADAPPPDPGSNDAQFQDWLSGLKRT